MAKKDDDDATNDSSKVWSVMSLVVGLLAASVTRKALNGSWKAATGKEPPANPADPDVELREAIMWAAVSGTAVAVARMFAGRRAAHYYKRSTGHLPPELQADSAASAAAAAAKGDVQAAKRGKK